MRPRRRNQLRHQLTIADRLLGRLPESEDVFDNATLETYDEYEEEIDMYEMMSALIDEETFGPEDEDELDEENEEDEDEEDEEDEDEEDELDEEGEEDLEEDELDEEGDELDEDIWDEDSTGYYDEPSDAETSREK